MKTKHWTSTLGLILMLLLNGCVEPYLPEVMEAPNSYLVVNGYINADGQTTIQLLRSQNLNEDTPPPHENGAIVMIVAEDGERYNLVQPESSIYMSAPLTLDENKKYGLFIRTRDGKEYESDFVEVKKTPAISEVDWEAVDGKVELNVSTEDPANKTWYYRWEFEQTWHFRSAFNAMFKYENGRVLMRDNTDEDIYNCWTTEHSRTVELATSKRLSQDKIHKYKLLSIPSDSEKIAIKYSILVKQYALTQEAYTYWETIKKNTENIGTLFDPLPSQIMSNIRCVTTPDEPVIGFIAAGSMEQKRIFIDAAELPRDWRLFNPICSSDTLRLAEANIADYFEGGYNMPVSAIYAGGSMTPIGYIYAAKRCVDCRIKGTNVKPDFWE